MRKIYANEYLFEDGSHRFAFYEDESERDYHFTHYSGLTLLDV